jgi:hypothetical protein
MNKFEALKQFQAWPDDWQALCVEYLCVEEGIALPNPTQDQPKVALKPGYLSGADFADYELKEIEDLLDSGCNQSEAARVMHDRHGQARSLGAYKLKANQVAQKMRARRKRAK